MKLKRIKSLGEEAMRKYSATVKRRIREKYNDMCSGRCVCLRLKQAQIDGEIGPGDYARAFRLEIRCPLSVSGVCDRCRADAPHKIDMYQAVRDLSIIPAGGALGPSPAT